MNRLTNNIEKLIKEQEYEFKKMNEYGVIARMNTESMNKTIFDWHKKSMKAVLEKIASELVGNCIDSMGNEILEFKETMELLDDTINKLIYD